MLRIFLAAMHLAALGIGVGGVWARASALGERPLSAASARRAFVGDTWWGLAAALWISTGLWRLLAGTEKATAYYTHNHVFFAKMGFFVLIFLLEVWPMITLIRWRSASAKLRDEWVPDAVVASRIRVISLLQTALVLCMVVAAVMMARGYGANA